MKDEVEAIKLNLGAGDTQVEGFTPVDRKFGSEVYPLAYEDGTVTEARASHILEHFSHQQTERVLREWVRVLKPGGVIKIAVPDFDKLVKLYESGETIKDSQGNAIPTEAFLMGGHLDNSDVHLAIFNEQKLRDLMTMCGLVDIKPWRDKVVDCHIYPFSLNLQGRKLYGGEPGPGPEPVPEPHEETMAEKMTRHVGRKLKISAIMSVPRLGFMDNFTCAYHAMLGMGIPFRTFTGAYWGQCLQRAMQMQVDEGFDAILTLDYDSVFTRDALQRLVDTFEAHPEIDALAPVECHRSLAQPLMTIEGEDGNLMPKVPTERFFNSDLLKIRTAHFGLTLIRVEALKKMPLPWFWGQPGLDGKWGDGKVDDDIYFWLEWKKAGNSLYLANRVVIGHEELTIRWPGRDFRAVLQAPSEFAKEGPPMETWQ